MPDETPTPNRGEVFASETAKVVWNAILALKPSDQFEVLTHLQIRLAAGDVKADSHDLRVLGAQAALRRAAEVLGHSPSVEEYRSLRSEHKDAGFPSDGTIRRILGGSWNDALASAHLQTVEGGDMVIASLGVAFTRDELIAGLRECAQELGMAPSVPQYLGWARRPEVRRRANGRRARAIEAYNRVFGSWTKGLVAAGLIDGSDPEVLTRVADGRTRIYKITDDGIAAAIREITDHLGHVPSTIEYQSAREELLNAAIKEGVESLELVEIRGR
jgi:Homing endonuclease associated repeat